MWWGAWRKPSKINNDNANETWINEKLSRKIHKNKTTNNRGDENA